MYLTNNMLCKAISLDANKNIIRSRIPLPVKVPTPADLNDASWLDPTKTKKCYICGEVIDVSSSGCVIAQFDQLRQLSLSL